MTLSAARDIAIIALALESLVVGVLLILLLWQLRRLSSLLEEQVKPMLQSLQETVGTLKGTTSLVSETIVTPAIRIGGFASGVRRALQVLLQPSSDSESS
jgi:hypothetical protein